MKSPSQGPYNSEPFVSLTRSERQREAGKPWIRWRIQELLFKRESWKAHARALFESTGCVCECLPSDPFLKDGKEEKQNPLVKSGVELHQLGGVDHQKEEPAFYRAGLH